MIDSKNLGIVEITAPPSKSLSHRYLIAAALANGNSTLHNVLYSDDLKATRQILSLAGATITQSLSNKSEDLNVWHICGMKSRPVGADPLRCNVQESGTTCRLLTAVLAAGTGLFHISGEGRMHSRPIGELCNVLQSLGAEIQYEGTPGCPPFLLKANGLDPSLVDGFVQIGMDNSSQFFSALLLAAPLAKSPMYIELSGKKAVSWPYVGLTLQCLSDFGIKFDVEQLSSSHMTWRKIPKADWSTIYEVKPKFLRVRVWPGEYKAGNYTIEGDWSAASYFLSAGALGSKPVRVSGLNINSMQGDRVIIDILQKFGANIKVEENAIVVFPSHLHGVTLDMGSCPDLVPTVAALACFASGSTCITNVAHLRLKESDRLEAPALELRKIGATIDVLSDGLLINGISKSMLNKIEAPNTKGKKCFSAHNDHRMAMSLALLEMQASQLDLYAMLDNPSVVSKSFPDFWKLWSCLK